MTKTLQRLNTEQITTKEVLIVKKWSKKLTNIGLVLLIMLFASFAEVWAMENNTDRPGRDYKSFDLSSPNPYTCQTACENEEQCQAWTYVKPDVQGPQARCWLKNSGPTPTMNTCCISGVIDTDGAGSSSDDNANQ